MVVFLEKTYQYEHEECQKCLFFLWVYSFEGSLEMSVNLRTSSREVELKEMNVLNEEIAPGKHTKYLVNVYPDKPAVITVRVAEGAASVVIKDSVREMYNVKLNAEDQDYQDFLIRRIAPSDDELADEGQVDVAGLRGGNDKDIFKPVHVVVTATSQTPLEFFISYSIGQGGLYLEDGVVEQRELSPGEPQTFFYMNRDKKSHAYLTLSSEPMEALPQERKAMF